ncbi:hypothetical protein [Candidatus Methylacidithermus pantelleriae]|uniref:hypothetical protein n=1 Tax=Candidatus Methylacidithermus pantelleriae TaxID=2744239 RepID=UPI00157D8483|nr:hypothetical protein [Candidatus Methylacidithermus pantelleriae]
MKSDLVTLKPFQQKPFSESIFDRKEACTHAPAGTPFEQCHRVALNGRLDTTLCIWIGGRIIQSRILGLPVGEVSAANRVYEQ